MAHRPRKPRPTAVSVAMAAAAAAASPSCTTLGLPQGDDEVLRRRLQYKIYQRHHRARQRSKTSRLEGEVAALVEEIAQLSAQYQMLASQNVGVFVSRSTMGGAPAQVVAEFYRLFEHGHDVLRSDVQAQFLRSTMVPNVQGPDFKGVEALVDQWRIYGSLFHRTHYCSTRMEIETYGDVTVVVAHVTMSMRPTRYGALCLYPSISGEEPTIQNLVTNLVKLFGSVRFVFDATGNVTWFGADMDFVTGLMTVLGTAERVSQCVEDANLSLNTGRIMLTKDDKYGWRKEKPPRHPRGTSSAV